MLSSRWMRAVRPTYWIYRQAPTLHLKGQLNRKISKAQQQQQLTKICRKTRRAIIHSRPQQLLEAPQPPANKVKTEEAPTRKITTARGATTQLGVQSWQPPTIEAVPLPIKTRSPLKSSSRTRPRQLVRQLLTIINSIGATNHHNPHRRNKNNQRLQPMRKLCKLRLPNLYLARSN